MISELLTALREQKQMGLKGGIYHKTLIDMTYNSNHIEGSRLTHEQTRYIFETNTIGITQEAVNVNDIVETVNHFRCMDMVIDHATDELSTDFIKELHRVLKTGTSDSRKDWFAVGGYKRLPNEVGGEATCAPELVEERSCFVTIRKAGGNLKTFLTCTCALNASILFKTAMAVWAASLCSRNVWVVALCLSSSPTN